MPLRILFVADLSRSSRPRADDSQRVREVTLDGFDDVMAAFGERPKLEGFRAPESSWHALRLLACVVPAGPLVRLDALDLAPRHLLDGRTLAWVLSSELSAPYSFVVLHHTFGDVTVHGVV
jgi:hypothetical protein